MTKLRINIVAILVLFVTCVAVAQPASTDTVQTLKKQLLKRIDNAVSKTCIYLSAQPVDSIDIALTYPLLDILKTKFELPIKMANRIEVETKYPEIAAGRLKMYGVFYANNNTIPFSKEEIEKLKNEPVTSLFDDKYLMASAMFCNELPVPKEYATTFMSRMLKYHEKGTGIDPIMAGITFSNVYDGNCKAWRKGQLDTLRTEISYALTNKYAGNLRGMVSMDWFFSEDMNTLPLVMATALKYHIGDCDYFTYDQLFKIIEKQNTDGGWHMLVKEDKSSYSASVANLWLLLEMKRNIDCIDKTADEKLRNEGEVVPEH